MTEPVLIALGSNVDKERMLPAAIAELRRHPALRVLAVSPIYETLPVGGSTAQPSFYNAAALLETELSLAELREALRAIEARLGRVRTADKFAPRTIDLDIAMFGPAAFESDGRHYPDPGITHYPHLALPLADVAGAWVHPVLGLTLREIADALAPSAGGIRRVE